jgi:hypothetical protein
MYMYHSAALLHFSVQFVLSTVFDFLVILDGQFSG